MRDNLLGFLEKALPHLRQLDPMAGNAMKFDSIVFLQEFELVGDRRLAQVKLLCGLRDIGVLCNSRQDPELMQCHGYYSSR
jgi:hypothetical protein